MGSPPKKRWRWTSSAAKRARRVWSMGFRRKQSLPRGFNADALTALAEKLIMPPDETTASPSCRNSALWRNPHGEYGVIDSPCRKSASPTNLVNLFQNPAFAGVIAYERNGTRTPVCGATDGDSVAAAALCAVAAAGRSGGARRGAAGQCDDLAEAGDFTLGTNFKAWAFSVARYEVLNYRKQQARDARLVFSEELEETFAEELAARRRLGAAA